MCVGFGGEPGLCTMGEFAADARIVIISCIGDFVDFFNVVFRIVFFDAVGAQDVYGFVVGNCCFDFTAVAPYKNIAVEMNLYSVDGLSAPDLSKYAVIGIDDFDVGITEVMGIIVGKHIIPPADCMAADSVA